MTQIKQVNTDFICFIRYGNTSLKKFYVNSHLQNF